MSEELKCRNNQYPLRGVIYAKKVRTAPDKKGKNGGKDYEFPSIVIEVKREYKGKEYITLPEFEIGRGVGLDDFEVGDRVEVVFALDGKTINPTWHKTVAKAIYLRHTDIQTSDIRSVGGESHEEKRLRQKAEKDIFQGASPLDDADDDDLPF